MGAILHQAADIETQLLVLWNSEYGYVLQKQPDVGLHYLSGSFS